ncbi:hypothetical protein [Streptomyces sp. NPDC052721]|uniref:effector-associated constant component EACC1 n=1 Tax=Streptomyces sp. NPDC052721 TaxID=3154955 RepID=UPI003434A518
MTLAGGLLDVLSIAFSSGVSLATFVTAIFAWRAARNRSPKITVRRGDTQFTLNAEEVDPEVLQSLLRQLDTEGSNGEKKTARDDSDIP